jgi:hypothetical protein
MVTIPTVTSELGSHGIDPARDQRPPTRFNSPSNSNTGSKSRPRRYRSDAADRARGSKGNVPPAKLLADGTEYPRLLLAGANVHADDFARNDEFDTAVLLTPRSGIVGRYRLSLTETFSGD